MCIIYKHITPQTHTHTQMPVTMIVIQWLCFIEQKYDIQNFGRNLLLEHALQQMAEHN